MPTNPRHHVDNSLGHNLLLSQPLQQGEARGIPAGGALSEPERRGRRPLGTDRSSLLRHAPGRLEGLGMSLGNE